MANIDEAQKELSEILDRFSKKHGADLSLAIKVKMGDKWRVLTYNDADVTDYIVESYYDDVKDIAAEISIG